MKKYISNSSFSILILNLLIVFIFTGCSFLGGIFEAGVKVGIFLVIALIIIILILINRFRKR